MAKTVFGFPVLEQQDPEALGGFRAVARLGKGGMGQVFLALSPGGQPAAVKVIRGEFAADPEFRRRFAREVATAQKVRGAHLAPLLDADLENEQPWLASTYVAGPSLRDLVTGHGPLPAEQVTLLAWGIAHALSDIHAAEVVHRDLKPGNIMLDESGPKVIDFGIVKSLTQSATHHSGSTRIGTPLYMSPEQALGRPVGAASDLFGLGSTLYYLATGEEAFAAENQWAVAHRIVADHPDLGTLPAPLRELIAACLHKDPDQRPTPRQVQARCETDLGGTPFPGAWTTITGAHEAIRQRTGALRTLTAPAKRTGTDHREAPVTHPPTVLDASRRERAGATLPAPPGNTAGSVPSTPQNSSDTASKATATKNTGGSIPWGGVLATLILFALITNELWWPHVRQWLAEYTTQSTSTASPAQPGSLSENDLVACQNAGQAKNRASKRTAMGSSDEQNAQSDIEAVTVISNAAQQADDPTLRSQLSKLAADLQNEADAYSQRGRDRQAGRDTTMATNSIASAGRSIATDNWIFAYRPCPIVG
ncbi:serine/threonine-protein kinase [Streptomyces sp. NPDC005828]|uniref:serine/threonine-protein kinase n=1 Tax=Streptomyces sp. NPDC005828 TaxID=3157071 RepID=UPI0033CACC83